MRRRLALFLALASTTGAAVALPAAPGRALPISTATTCTPPASRPAGWDGGYIGHTAFRNMPLYLNLSEEAEHELVFDTERSMGLTWSFASLIWGLYEPAGPSGPDTALQTDPAGAWGFTDRYVAAARTRQMNLLFQPAVGLNGHAPAWAGRRTPIGYGEEQAWTDPYGGSYERGAGAGVVGPPVAPANIDALVDWYRRLVRRYKPCGTLAQEQGWTDGYGVSVWEIDNEPDAYGLWFGEWDDYAEIFVKVSAAIHAEDPNAVVIGPAPADTGDEEFLMAVLDKRAQRSSLEYMLNGDPYGIGPSTDVVSVHHYDGLVAVEGARLEDTYRGHKAWWDHYANHPVQPELAYDPALDYWHTEGGLDYAGSDSDPDLRARGIVQFLIRGFAVGFDKMVVQDLHETSDEKTNARNAVTNLVSLLPRPQGIARLTAEDAPTQLFRHGDARWTYAAWSAAGQGEQTISVPVRTATARVVDKYGTETVVSASGGSVTVTLPAAPDVNETVFVVEI